MEVDEAYSLIARAIDTGHVAHGYLISGELGGNCTELARRILRKLFPDALDQVEAGTHPDVRRIEPQGRSRTIKVERSQGDDGPGMRDGLIGPMAVTSFSGGWKVGIIYGADRMQPAAANAFLKSLEEPAPKTMYLLLTDVPDAIMPTIRSRTQRIDLPLPEGVLEGEAYEQVAEAFAARDGKALAGLLSALKDEAEDADVPQVRKAFYKTVMSFVRKLMLGERLPRHQAFRNIEAVEEAYRQSERSMSDEAVLCFLMDRIVFPA